MTARWAPKTIVDPMRRRSLRSLRLWAALGLGLGFAAWRGDLALLWRVDHPWALPAALLAGHALLFFSMLITRLSLNRAARVFIGSFRQLYRPYGLETLAFYAVLCAAEELLFRAVPLSHLCGTTGEVFGLALIFAGLHVREVALPSLLKFVELTLFGALQGAIFLWLGDLWPLVLIHFVRNGSIAKVFVRQRYADAELARRATEEG